MLALYGTNLGTYVRPGSLTYGGGAGITTGFWTGVKNVASAAFGPSTSITRPPPSGQLTPPPMPPVQPSAPTIPPVVITTTPPPEVPIGPSPDLPGAGPHISTSPSAGGGAGAWYDLFDPSSFAWWKPVLLASGIALFGGAILAMLKRKK